VIDKEGQQWYTGLGLINVSSREQKNWLNKLSRVDSSIQCFREGEISADFSGSGRVSEFCKRKDSLIEVK